MNASGIRVVAAGCLALAVMSGVATVAHAQTDAAIKSNLAWQIALEKAGFSPGVIDGKPGSKTALATREFQRSRGLAVTGQADAATTAALQIDPSKALTTYTIRAQDSNDVGPTPKDWNEKARLPRLAYESLAALVGEKFHCSQNCLASLNPGRPLAALKVGDTLNVPSPAADAASPRGTRIEISFAEKALRVLDDANHVVALFHCSIAADKDNLPTVRSTTIVSITHNPTYRFDPEMWPEVRNVHSVLEIPKGPRNPVGLCWMGLALKGYGMHGTPAPDMIGKTGSHGCFRLTNWDAVRLSGMVHEGMSVAFVQGAGEGHAVPAAPALAVRPAAAPAHVPAAVPAAPAHRPSAPAAPAARAHAARTNFD
jgi:lipoprotein-anchoring transpeptidase ErfK/SrfK